VGLQATGVSEITVEGLQDTVVTKHGTGGKLGDHSQASTLTVVVQYNDYKTQDSLTLLFLYWS